MARKSGSTITQDELYPASADVPSAETPRRTVDDARLVDLESDEQSPFLRAQKRVSARRTSIPRKTVNHLLRGAVVVTILSAAGLAGAVVYRYSKHNWRFRVDSSDDIEVTGTENVTKAQIMEVMGADIGRNIFFVPLAQQQTQLEQIPWVESASVMRFVPNRLKVEIQERRPVAFARVGPRIELIDATGTLMEMSPKRKYSFPVILGMNPGEPLSTRAPRMKAYADLTRDLDSDGAHYTQDLSEVDLTDLDDIKVRVNDPQGDVLLHLGASNYLQRYKIYVAHAQEWRQQFQKLDSVNLRYDNQVIVNPDLPPATKTAALGRAAVGPGVQQAALVTRMGVNTRGIPKPVFELSESKLNAKAAGAKKTAGKTRVRRTVVRTKRYAAAKKRATAKPVSSARWKAGATQHARAVATQSARTLARPAVSSRGSGASSAGRLGKPSPAIAQQQGIVTSNE